MIVEDNIFNDTDLTKGSCWLLERSNDLLKERMARMRGYQIQQLQQQQGGQSYARRELMNCTAPMIESEMLACWRGCSPGKNWGLGTPTTLWRKAKSCSILVNVLCSVFFFKNCNHLLC